MHVDKELFGDTFRSPPRLTPLEARAIRLALDFVGPMVAAEAHRPLDRVRRKLEETFGGFDLAQTPEPHTDKAEERLIRTLTEGIRRRRVVEIVYQKEGDEAAASHLVEPYVFERKLPNWYIHTWDRTRKAKRSFRLDRMRSADLTAETFEPHEDFEPDWLSGARVARIHYSKDIARWEIERGAMPLRDGSAVVEARVACFQLGRGDLSGAVMAVTFLAGLPRIPGIDTDRSEIPFHLVEYPEPLERGVDLC